MVVEVCVCACKTMGSPVYDVKKRMKKYGMLGNNLLEQSDLVVTKK